MAIRERDVKNKKTHFGGRSGQAGTVYDVNIKFKSEGRSRTYAKKGFLTMEDALSHQHEMTIKLADPDYLHRTAQQAKQPLSHFLLHWLDTHVKPYLRESTYLGYRSHINAHIIPQLGDTPLCELTSTLIDEFYEELRENGISDSTVQGVRSTMSTALEYATKKEYIPRNVAKSSCVVLVRNQPELSSSDCKELAYMMESLLDAKWRLILTLAGLYGLRMNEILGLRWCHVGGDSESIQVIEQLPRTVSAKVNIIEKMAPSKSKGREIPLTKETAMLFLTEYQSNHVGRATGRLVYDNDLVICRRDGGPENPQRILEEYHNILTKLHLPKSRFHDLRRSAATNIHNLTGDFFTISQILGHSVSGTASLLGAPDAIQTSTDQYISSQGNRMREVLSTYHAAVLGDTYTL